MRSIQEILKMKMLKALAFVCLILTIVAQGRSSTECGYGILFGCTGKVSKDCTKISESLKSILRATRARENEVNYKL